jgi:purine-binding chemotaxis protein CheW
MNAAARAAVTGARWVLFSLDARRYALPLDSVERIVHAAEVTPLPLAPEAVLGALDIAGEILPVYDLRRRFKLPTREIRISDQFVVALTARRRVVLVVDAALGVHDETSASFLETEPRDTTIRGVVALADGLVLITDLERFLSADETQALDAALDSIRHGEVRRAR